MVKVYYREYVTCNKEYISALLSYLIIHSLPWLQINFLFIKSISNLKKLEKLKIKNIYFPCIYMAEKGHNNVNVHIYPRV